jgi:hypothetical protein
LDPTGSQLEAHFLQPKNPRRIHTYAKERKKRKERKERRKGEKKETLT